MEFSWFASSVPVISTKKYSKQSSPIPPGETVGLNVFCEDPQERILSGGFEAPQFEVGYSQPIWDTGWFVGAKNQSVSSLTLRVSVLCFKLLPAPLPGPRT